MNYLHLPSSLRSTAATWNFPLGIEGFRYADLNRVRRLMALFQVFCDEVRAVDPALAERYQHGRDQHATITPPRPVRNDRLSARRCDVLPR